MARRGLLHSMRIAEEHEASNSTNTTFIGLQHSQSHEDQFDPVLPQSISEHIGNDPPHAHPSFSQRRRYSLDPAYYRKLSGHVPEEEAESVAIAKHGRRSSLRRSSIKRMESLSDLVQDEVCFRRISLPGWAIKGDWEKTAEKHLADKPDRRGSLQNGSQQQARWKRQSLLSLEKMKGQVPNQQTQPQRTPLKVSAKNRFRRVATIAVWFISMYRKSCDNVSVNYLKNKKLGSVKKDVIAAWAQDEVNNAFQQFNLNYYRVKRDIVISPDCKKTLIKTRVTRTEPELQRLMVALKWIRAFVSYPRDMQRQLCRVANYAKWGPGRTIVQQGHHANGVYYIMNGTLAIIGRDETGWINSVNILRQGQEFGVDCLIKGYKTQASIISMTTVEVLAIEFKDFEAIFMAEGVRKILGADYENFIGNIAFLKGWPIYKLSENPSSCMFHYFNSGEVIVKDSNDSDWIYIVKSGSVSVMKRLTQVPARKSFEHVRQVKIAKQGLNVNVSFKERKRRRKLLSPLKLPDVPKPEFQSQFELQMRMNETIPGLYKENDRLGILDYETILHDYKSYLHLPKQSEVTSPRDATSEINTDRRPNVKDQPDDIQGPPELPEITKTTRGVYMSAKQGRTRPPTPSRTEDETVLPTDSPEPEPEKVDDVADDRRHSRSRLPELFPITLGLEQPIKEEPSPGGPPGTKPVFILVQVLEKGQYFGVGGIVFRDTQPSVSLVSNGAECLLLSKPFFRQHASEAIINRLRRTEVPYPTEGEMQEKLQEYTDWRSYRTDAYKQFVQPLVTGKARREQFTNNYKGMYNYRTGPA